MYYLGFLKHNTKDVVIFRALKRPKQHDYQYFTGVMGPYGSEGEARKSLNAMRGRGYRENPSAVSRAKYCRERQLSPSGFAKGSFRTITLGRGEKGVVACPKGQYKHGKCGVGTRLQTILHPVGTRGCPVGGLELKKRMRNSANYLSDRQALALTKKVIALGKKLFKHEQSEIRQNPEEQKHAGRFVAHMKTLEKYAVGSKPYIEALAKAYEHLQAAKEEMKK